MSKQTETADLFSNESVDVIDIHAIYGKNDERKAAVAMQLAYEIANPETAD